MSDKKFFRTGISLLILAAVGFAVYGKTLSHEFAFDEYLLISENYSLHQVRNLPDFFTSKFWPGQARGIYYRPIITTSYALNYALGKTRARTYHATNLGFHLMNCFLVFILLARLRIPGAFLAALIFAVHPVHTESVTWISGRTDLIAVFFMLCAWLGWLKQEQTQGIKKAGLAICTILAFALAMLSKEIAIVFPLLLIIFDRTSIKKQAPVFILLLIVAGLYLIIRQAVLAGPGPEPAPAFFSGQSLWTRIQVMALVWLVYFRLLFIPYPLRVDYFYSQAYKPEEICGPVTWLALFCIILLVVLAIYHYRRRPLFSRLILACAISLLPFSHLVSIPTLMAERFLYLASIFACVAVAWLLFLVFQKYKSMAIACGVALLMLFSALTIARNQDWQNGFRLWRVSIRQAPLLAEGHNLLGIFAMKQGRFNLARQEYLAALRLDPEFSQARMNLSQIYYQSRDFDHAEKLLLIVIEQNPDLSSAHYNLALVYQARGEWDKALKALENAVQLEPGNLSAHYALGKILMYRKDRLEEAKDHLRMALEMDPAFLPALIDLAQLMALQGKTSEVLALIKRGLKSDPENQALLILRTRISGMQN